MGAREAQVHQAHARRVRNEPDAPEGARAHGVGVRAAQRTLGPFGPFVVTGLKALSVLTLR